ncbi:MAG: hypothetical protein JOZ84_12620 [Methylobacteriaceae bacterium]|nr:hypothetical protein [Methylobacteriaceae bacterium]
MQKDLARRLIRSAFRSASESQSVLPLLKQQLPPADYKRYAHGVASATDAINQALLDPALAAFPELSQEVEASLKKHGRYL